MLSVAVGCNKKPEVKKETTTPNIVTGKDVKDTLSSLTDNKSISETTNLNTVTLAEFKQNFAGSVTVNENRQAPLYNVQPTQPFTIHFNTKEKIDPIKAVTIHTDATCSYYSQIDTLNYGYIVSDGVDVIVSPSSIIGTGLLNSEDRIDNSYEYDGTWGHAGIYYLCIHYDTESESTIKLNDSIIVPFTIRSDVDTPAISYYINNDGNFVLTWSPVEGATGYRIYNSTGANNRLSHHPEAKEMTSEELGYAGINPEFVKAVDGSTTEYVIQEGSFEYNGNVNSQNNSLGDYFITAVSGNSESNFSAALPVWKYRSLLPNHLETNLSGLMLDRDYLPSHVNVVMADGSISVMAVDYKLLKRDYGKSTYQYTIPGTLLSGEVSIEEPEERVQQEIKNAQPTLGGVQTLDNHIPMGVSSRVSRTDYGYSTPYVDCFINDGYDEESLIKVEKNAYTAMVDISSLRIVEKGYISDEAIQKRSSLDFLKHEMYPTKRTDRANVHPDNLYGNYVITGETGETVAETQSTIQETVATTQAPETRQAIEYTQAPETRQAVEYTQAPETTQAIEYTQAPETTQASETSRAIEYTQAPETTRQTETTHETVDTTIESTTESNIEEVIPETTEVNVTIDTDETEGESVVIEEVDEEDVQVQLSDYPLFCDSYDEAYIATALASSVEMIPLSPMPALMDRNYLLDVIYKVTSQNPYANPITAVSARTATDGETYLMPKYEYSASDWASKQAAIAKEADKLSNEIFDGQQSAKEKVDALWTWYENNTKYDDDALNYAVSHGMTDIAGFEDSFNAYGILCKKVGVCNSYALVTTLLLNNNGVDCKVLTGDLSGVKHAWNLVTIDGEYYWLDNTNNKTNSGIEYLLLTSTTDVAKSAGYTLEDDCEIDSILRGANNYTATNNKYDYYSNNNLEVSSIDDIANFDFDISKGHQSFRVVGASPETVLSNLDRDSATKIVEKLGTTEIGTSLLPPYVQFTWD